MAEESEVLLDSQLKKLIMSSTKLHTENKINPFITQYQQQQPQQVTQEELFGPTCNCSSEKHAQGNSAVVNSQGHSRHQFNKNNKNILYLEKNIRNAIQFKQKGRPGDKRSNILKASKFLAEVGKCIHNKQLRIEKEEGSVYNNKLVKAKSFGDLSGKGLDFKELLKQCSAITITTPRKSSILIKNLSFMRNEDVLNNDFTRPCFKTIRISSSLIPKLCVPAIAASNKFPKQRRNSIGTTVEKISSMSLTSGAGSTPNSSSCSQQALININPGSSGDVTIDEIASYFENILFIPKKMSEMAEMMYI